jgi:hypothetical protein
MANGFDSYVADQSVNSHGTVTVNANSMSDWQGVANLSDCGGCVQVYLHDMQLMNGWCGSGWHGCPNPTDTPLDSLASLVFHYDETSPQSGASYQYAADIWDNGYGSDIMLWVDTHGRCNEGAFGSTVLGHVTFGGQNWTVHRYGGVGAEIIMVLDGPGGPGTCAQQPTGTMDIKAALGALAAGGWIDPHPVLSNIDSGWEVTQSSGQTFKVNDFSITAALN